MFLVIFGCSTLLNTGNGNAQKMAIQSIVHRFSFYLCMKYNITNT